MCLIVFNWQPNSEQWLALSANRDEFYERAAQPLQEWPSFPGLYAGKDVSAGGTWMGVTQSGRWAALTNIRLGKQGSAVTSRGHLVLDYLTSSLPPEVWVKEHDFTQYSPFNLLVGTKDRLWYCRNHPESLVQPLAAGYYSLSNGQLNSAWPKSNLALNQLKNWQAGTPLDTLLSHRGVFPDEQLPETGVSLEWERILSAQFILTPIYGTRSSASLVGYKHQIEYAESSWDQAGNCSERHDYQLDWG